MIKAPNNTEQYCYIACPSSQPCPCRNRKYPIVPEETIVKKDKKLDD